MPSTASVLRRAPRILAVFVLQAIVWVVVAVAFATLIEVAGWAHWNDALYFSAVNWLPWIVIAPAVFWLARRFPFERAHLLRSVPVHALACAGCIVLVLWISALFSPIRRPPGGQRNIPGTELRANENRSHEARDHGGNAEPHAPEARTEEPVASSSSGAATSSAPLERTAIERRERWLARAGGFEHKEGGRWSGERGAGPGYARPPPPEGVPGVLRRWAFLGSFWPPFNSALLRVNFSLAVYMIVACLAHALGYYRRAEERERQALALAAGFNQAKLDAMRLQLQPHFLFNTLNAISALVHRNPNAADELIADLSELLRLSLQAADNEVPLSRELELLDCYLAIERTRLGERLRIERDIDPEVLGAMVPTFILQPLAENAVRHGIEPRRGAGLLAISAHRSGEELRLVVADDGVGLKPADAGTARRGIGLANAEERLRTLHGARARLDLVTPESGGLQVRIVLPLRIPAAKSMSPAPA